MFSTTRFRLAKTIESLPRRTLGYHEREYIPNAIVLRGRGDKAGRLRVRSSAEYHRIISSCFPATLNMKTLMEKVNPVIISPALLHVLFNPECGNCNAEDLPAVLTTVGGEPLRMNLIPNVQHESHGSACDEAFIYKAAEDALGVISRGELKNSYSNARRRKGLVSFEYRVQSYVLQALLELFKRNDSVDAVLNGLYKEETYLPTVYHNDTLYVGDQTAAAIEKGMMITIDKNRGKSAQHAKAIVAAWEMGFDVVLPELSTADIPTEALKYDKPCGMLLMGHLLIHYTKITKGDDLLAGKTKEASTGKHNDVLHVTKMEVVNDSKKAANELESLSPRDGFCRQLAKGQSDFDVRTNHGSSLPEVLGSALPFTYKEVSERYENVLSELLNRKSGAKVDFEDLATIQNLCPNVDTTELFHKLFTPAALMEPTNPAANPPVNRHSKARSLDFAEVAKEVLEPVVRSHCNTALDTYKAVEKKGRVSRPSLVIDPRQDDITPAAPCDNYAELYTINQPPAL